MRIQSQILYSDWSHIHIEFILTHTDGEYIFWALAAYVDVDLHLTSTYAEA
jgi:hypothetical protein